MSRYARHGGRGAYGIDPAGDEVEEYELAAGYDQDPGRVPESAWERARAWHLQAPAERLPITGALLTWPASWLAYTTMVPGRYVGFAAIFASACTAATWAKHNRDFRAAIEAERNVLPPQRLTAGEAWLVSVAIGGWITAAVTWGPLAGPFHILSAVYAAGVIIGYWWLRRHPAVRAARDRRDDDATWIAEKSEWHRIAPVAGLADFDLQAAEPTHLGKQLLLTGSPNGTLASRIAGRPKSYEEKLCHLLDLPYGSVGISGTAYPGELLVDIRSLDPAAAMGSLLHPAIDPGSPYVGWFPARPSVRNPIVYGVTPETGEPMKLALWNQYGGRTIYLVAKTRWGKTMVLNCIRERVTLMDDAVLVQINGAKVGDEKAWEPLSAITAAGAAQMGDPSHAQRIMATLEWLQLLITARSETHIRTGDSVFQPTPQDPAYIIIIDEIDEVAKIPGASAILQFLASKQASEAVSLIKAGQRYTQAWVGGAGVQMNVAEVLVGLLNKSSEARHITGAEYELPDIAEYAKGEKGFWQVWDTDRKRVTGRGRAFDIGSIGDQQVIIAERVDQGRAPSLPPGFEFMPGSTLEQAAEDGGRRLSPTEGDPGGGSLRDRFASVFDMDSRRPARHARPEPARSAAPPAPLAPVVQIPGVPPVLVPVMMAELAQGTSARKLSDAFRRAALAVGKTKAHEYLTAAVAAGAAVLEGEGRGSEYRLPPDDAVPADPSGEPEGEGPDGGYTTIEALAEAVAAGEMDVDDSTRAVLMRARDLASREGPRRHLAGLPPTGTGDES